MIRCSNCGTFYEEMSRSNCPKCGEKAHMSAGKCLLCGKEAERGDVCQKCIVSYQITEEVHEKEKDRKKSVLKPLIVALISLACIVGLTLWIIAPFKPTEETVTEEVYDTGEYIIKILDLYLDGIASSDDTREKLTDFTRFKGDDDSVDDSLLSIYISSAKFALLTNDVTDVKEARNNIADLINYKD